jgi:hypothetical protein
MLTEKKFLSPKNTKFVFHTDPARICFSFFKKCFGFPERLLKSGGICDEKAPCFLAFVRCGSVIFYKRNTGKRTNGMSGAIPRIGTGWSLRLVLQRGDDARQ